MLHHLPRGDDGRRSVHVRKERAQHGALATVPGAWYSPSARLCPPLHLPWERRLGPRALCGSGRRTQAVHWRGQHVPWLAVTSLCMQTVRMTLTHSLTTSLGKLGKYDQAAPIFEGMVTACVALYGAANESTLRFKAALDKNAGYANGGDGAQARSYIKLEGRKFCVITSEAQGLRSDQPAKITVTMSIVAVNGCGDATEMRLMKHRQKTPHESQPAGKSSCESKFVNLTAEEASKLNDKPQA